MTHLSPRQKDNYSSRIDTEIWLSVNSFHLFPSHLEMQKAGQVVVAHTFIPSTWETEADRSL